MSVEEADIISRRRSSRRSYAQYALKQRFEHNRTPIGEPYGQLAPGIAVKMSAIDDLGCFATTYFLKDSLIAEYKGERISHEEAVERMRRPGKLRISQVNDNWSIDGSIGGNGTQYINHSCEPNSCAAIVDSRIFLFALRDIFPGEEITVDYLNSYELDRSSCHCGSVSCRNSKSRDKNNKSRY